MPFSETDVGLLYGSRLLAGLPQPEIFASALRARENQLLLPAGKVFLPAGFGDAGLFVVAHGTIELVATAPGGSEKIVQFVRTGGMFAEEGLFNGCKSRYLARTITSAAVLRLPEEQINAWLQASPPFAGRLMGLIAERTDYLQKDIVTFCTKSATARLVCYLVCQFNQTPSTADGSLALNIALPRSKLASRLGISGSHLSRAFNELERQGLIEKRRGGIFIPDVNALSRHVCPAGCAW